MPPPLPPRAGAKPRPCDRPRRSPSLVRHSAFGVLFLFLSAVLPLRADVFWRLPSRPDPVLQQLGGARLYATDVQVNGRPGTLAAYAFELPPATAGARLARPRGLPPPAAAPGGAPRPHAAPGRRPRPRGG
ncbi:MAG: hypothetical protein LBW77_05595, partial [Verrucomicrobiota bacterium]|nr:hypothetical protein [Verrucomicrobiota bacterium]